MPQINYQEPPITGNEVFDRYMLEMHNRVFGLGPDTSGDLDTDNGVLSTDANTDDIDQGSTNLYYPESAADSKVLSGSTNTSTADSKGASGGASASAADSRAISNSTNLSTTDSRVTSAHP